MRPRVGLRGNPEFTLRGAGMRRGGGPQQFGIDSYLIPGVLADIADQDLEFHGFHVFAGSQNLNAESMCAAQRHAAELVIRLAESSPAPVRYFTMGGGCGIP
ncbi:hypothetical protein AB0J21_30460 [Streptomyces sp. NPDC049954]|uniref:hypothetical protein n=1 Tax=Streptomyces sp. NPDC049954 TaxID=3155779 RepID=UPI00343ED815